jgi:hypothetical protein
VILEVVAVNSQNSAAPFANWTTPLGFLRLVAIMAFAAGFMAVHAIALSHLMGLYFADSEIATIGIPAVSSMVLFLLICKALLFRSEGLLEGLTRGPLTAARGRSEPVD